MHDVPCLPSECVVARPPAYVPLFAAFVRGWDMTLVMLAMIPALAGMGFAIAMFIGKTTNRINKAYAGACVRADGSGWEQGGCL